MKPLTMEEETLLREKAREARNHSYSPYSHYAVGAALLTEEGRIYQGCNIENAGFTPTICAERTAFFKAVFEGERHFRAIAITATGEDIGYPCGVCRQVMAEFCGGDFIILCENRDGSKQDRSLFCELLPHAFGPGAFSH